jgi:hypothetical protein
MEIPRMTLGDTLNKETISNETQRDISLEKNPAENSKSPNRIFIKSWGIWLNCTEEEKYSGGDDNFDQKLFIFNDNCDVDAPQASHSCDLQALQALRAFQALRA